MLAIQPKNYKIMLGLLLLLDTTLQAQTIRSILIATRDKYNLPAVGAAVIRQGKVAALDAIGVRKDGSDILVTRNDQFHLGSCTKAMTATMVAMLVEQGKLNWDRPLSETFPDMDMHPDYKSVTLRHLFMHRSGLPKESWPKGMGFMDVHRMEGNPRTQRRQYTEQILKQEPVSKPGTQYIYSNAGYTVAAVIAEEATNRSWEDLMTNMLFKPLGMKTAGFGAMGQPGKIDQPWQHKRAGNHLIPISPGPFSDNPPAIGPAGTVHCSLSDWVRFVQLHLGVRGQRLLRPETLQYLHTPSFRGDYALGWVVVERSWAGTKVLTHAGSNTMNYAMVWVVPEAQYAVLVVTNCNGDQSEKACDEAAQALIHAYSPQVENPQIRRR
ncbi:MAG: beta-lactamase family protein [Sedimentisphaerales bacterium]|nr:beta-lactamase family protein [Sedimentisphaerales bacterium]